jgi:hypothetical protein
MSILNNYLYKCDICGHFILTTAKIWNLKGLAADLHACSDKCWEQVRLINNENWREIIKFKPLKEHLEKELKRFTE